MIALNGQAINSDVVDYISTFPPSISCTKYVTCHLGRTHENKSVNIKFIYILSVSILFLFQETSVNKNIQVIEASGRGYMVRILILRTISDFV